MRPNLSQSLQYTKWVPTISTIYIPQTWPYDLLLVKHNSLTIVNPPSYLTISIYNTCIWPPLDLDLDFDDNSFMDNDNSREHGLTLYDCLGTHNITLVLPLKIWRTFLSECTTQGWLIRTCVRLYDYLETHNLTLVFPYGCLSFSPKNVKNFLKSMYNSLIDKDDSWFDFRIV